MCLWAMSNHFFSWLINPRVPSFLPRSDLKPSGLKKSWCNSPLLSHESLPNIGSSHSSWWHKTTKEGEEEDGQKNKQKNPPFHRHSRGKKVEIGEKRLVISPAHSLTSSPLSLWYSATYRLLSILLGMGLISVPSCSSIPFRLKRSSYVIKLMARPKCPKRPDLPMRWRYVSPSLGKSKLITTFTACISIPLVKRSVQTRFRHKPFRKSWNTRFLCSCLILA